MSETRCIGIADRSYDSATIANFSACPIICPGGKDDLILKVTGYESRYVNQIVSIELKRRGSDVLVWAGMVNNAMLCGEPRLLWSE